MSKFCKYFSLLTIAVLPFVSQAIWMQQNIRLYAGWNAVHIKVNPYDYNCSQVFGGGGIDQVSWMNFDHRDDGTGTVSSDTYAWYRDVGEPSTFSHVLGDCKFLIHAVAQTNLVIKGTPALASGKLRLGDLNLVGFNMPPKSESSEANLSDYLKYIDKYLEASPSIYRVKTDSSTIRVSYSATISTDTAYWVNLVCDGEIDYMGPIAVTMDSADRIVSWDNGTSPRTITIRNDSTDERVINIALEDSLAPPAGQGTKAGRIAVKSESIDWSQGYARRVYTPVTFPFTTNLAAGASFAFKIRPNVDAMPRSSGDYLGILAISDKGSTIGSYTFERGVTLHRIGLKASGALAASASPTGLWVGQVALTGVNRAPMLSSSKPEWNVTNIQDATQPFQFRVILHVADDGTVNLLKHAFIGSREGDDSTAAIMTDRETALAYRAKYPNAVIRRVSSANFPFLAPQAFDSPANFMKDGGRMSVQFTQFFKDRDNPFFHQFHPNHDSIAHNNGKPSWKDDGADGTGDYESWNIRRKVTLTFAGRDPTGLDDEEWNRTVIGGTYRENLLGLTKSTIEGGEETGIITEGAFRLYKRLDTPELMSGGVVR